MLRIGQSSRAEIFCLHWPLSVSSCYKSQLMWSNNLIIQLFREKNHQFNFLRSFSDDYLAFIQFVLPSTDPEMDTEVDSGSNTGFDNWLQEQIWMEEREKTESLWKQSRDTQGKKLQLPPIGRNLVRFCLKIKELCWIKPKNAISWTPTGWPGFKWKKSLKIFPKCPIWHPINFCEWN